MKALLIVVVMLATAVLISIFDALWAVVGVAGFAVIILDYIGALP